MFGGIYDRAVFNTRGEEQATFSIIDIISENTIMEKRQSRKGCIVWLGYGYDEGNKEATKPIFASGRKREQEQKKEASVTYPRLQAIIQIRRVPAL